MSIHPRNIQDLLLGPVAVEIDANLRRLRDRTAVGIFDEVVLELGCSDGLIERPGREQAVLDVATRWVDLHGWRATVSDDATRLHLVGRTAAIELALSPSITSFIAQDPCPRDTPRGERAAASSDH